MNRDLNFLKPFQFKNIKLSDGKEVAIKLTKLIFDKYEPKPILNLRKTYLAKPFIKYSGNYTFAELAILDQFKAHGWQGCWIDSFHNCLWDSFPATSTPFQLPKTIRFKLAALLLQKNITKIGAWDILAWEKDSLLFIESKSIPSRDKLRDSQITFLQIALNNGFDNDNFLIVEWDFA